MWLGFFLIINLTNYYVEVFKKDSIVLTMVESAKIASITNVDDSSRILEGHAEIEQESFESSFEQQFKKNVNMNIGFNDFQYQYLRNAEEKIMAVGVKVTDENGTQYSTILKDNTIK